MTAFRKVRHSTLSIGELDGPSQRELMPPSTPLSDSGPSSSPPGRTPSVASMPLWPSRPLCPSEVLFRLLSLLAFAFALSLLASSKVAWACFATLSQVVFRAILFSSSASLPAFVASVCEVKPCHVDVDTFGVTLQALQADTPSRRLAPPLGVDPPGWTNGGFPDWGPVSWWAASWPCSIAPLWGQWVPMHIWMHSLAWEECLLCL